MPRAGLTTEVVISAGAELADEIGLDGLTLAALAKRLGVRLPSLYKHIAGKPALQRHLAVRAKVELAGLLAKATAGRAKGEAIRGLAAAYSEWARAHPGRYAASLAAPAADDPEDVAASAVATEAVFDALAGYDLDEVTMIDAVRSLRAMLHGFMALQQRGAFGLDRPVESSLGWALDGFDHVLAGAATTR